MFYVIIFSLAAVLLVVAGLTTMSRRRQGLGAEKAGGTGSPTHATHADAAGRRNRKAKRAQSKHDRRKRH
jgi:hypothetical protein